MEVFIMSGLFGSLFDLNHDGEMEVFERTMEFMAFSEIMSDSEEAVEDDLMDELDLAGLDYDELSFMDEDERREVLEDAGLDPDDYDF